MIVEFEFDGETFMREINEEDILMLPKINDLQARLAQLWKDSWPFPANPTEGADAFLDWQSDDSWLDLFEFAERVMGDD